MAKSTQTFIANWRIDSVGGKVLEPGDKITIDLKEVEHLVAGGAMRAMGDEVEQDSSEFAYQEPVVTEEAPEALTEEPAAQ